MASAADNARCYDALTTVAASAHALGFRNPSYTDVDVTVEVHDLRCSATTPATSLQYTVNGYYLFSHVDHAMEPSPVGPSVPLPSADASTAGAMMMKKRNPFALPPLAEALGMQMQATVELDDDQRRELKVSWEKRASKGNVFHKLLYDETAKRRATTPVVRDGAAHVRHAYTLTDDEYAAFAVFYCVPELNASTGNGAAALTLYAERPADGPGFALPAAASGVGTTGPAVWAMWRCRVDTVLPSTGAWAFFPFDRQTLTVDLGIADADAPFNLLLSDVRLRKQALDQAGHTVCVPDARHLHAKRAQLRLSVRRGAAYYYVHVAVPAALVSALALIAFSVDTQDVATRAAIPLTLLLTSVAFKAAVR